MDQNNNFEYTDNDILELATRKTTKDDEDVMEEETQNNSPAIINHADTFQVFERTLKYVEQQNKYTAADLIMLQK